MSTRRGALGAPRVGLRLMPSRSASHAESVCVSCRVGLRLMPSRSASHAESVCVSCRVGLCLMRVGLVSCRVGRGRVAGARCRSPPFPGAMRLIPPGPTSMVSLETTLRRYLPAPSSPLFETRRRLSPMREATPLPTTLSMRTRKLARSGRDRAQRLSMRTRKLAGPGRDRAQRPGVAPRATAANRMRASPSEPFRRASAAPLASASRSWRLRARP